jgi:[ribosomal protein S5]-alanine N-acetyltransferase
MTTHYLLTDQSSPRLFFRRLQESDFSVWLDFFLDPYTHRYWKPHTTDATVLCRQWMDKQFWRYENNRGGINIMVHKETGSIIGFCGLLVQQVDDHEELEVAYSVLASWRNNGYATEGAQACIRTAFQNNWRNSLISIIHSDNLESQRVAEKNNMQPYRHTVYDNTPVIIYRINREREGI